MVTVLLLVIIYLSFISLGLPDSLAGVTLPSFQKEWGIPLASGGILSMIIIGGTVISSFFSDRIIKKLGTAKIVFLSCLTTGLALLGFSWAPSFSWLILLALPLGLGAGTVDTSLNNYVALHFKAHHMNWLHSFWGVGATLGPVIMSWNLINTSWRLGYRTVSWIQLSLALILLLSLPLWKKHQAQRSEPESAAPGKTNIFTIPGIPWALTTMVVYCALELGTGLWSTSYLVHVRGFAQENAARYTAIYYGGITAGRFLSGFISFKLTNRQLIRAGGLTALTGIILLNLPLPPALSGTGLILTGLGLAPVFPAMIHETPRRFGRDLSQKIIGFQMGFAYTGSAFIPPLLGLVYQKISVSWFPLTLLALVFILLLSTELLNRKN